jgi:hypothetical protein
MILDRVQENGHAYKSHQKRQARNEYYGWNLAMQLAHSDVQ